MEFIDFINKYGVVELAIGFIIDRRAIEYLRESGQTSIRWRFKVYH